MSSLVKRKNGWLFPVLAVILAILFYSLVASRFTGLKTIVFIPASILIAFTFFIYYKDCKGNKTVQFIAISFLIVELVLLVYNSAHRNLPFTNVDWLNYDYFAKNALASSTNIFEIFDNSVDLFTACIAIIYRVFGSDITIIYFYIFPLSFVLSHYLYKTIYLITQDDKRSKYYSLAILLIPVNFIFSVSVLREVPIQCMSIISLYYFLTYLIGDKKKGLYRAISFAVFAAMMHSGMIAILIVYLYVLVQKKLFKNVRILRLSTVLFAGLIIAAMSLPIFSSLTKRFDFSGGLDGVVTSVNTQNQYLLDASTNYVNSTPSNTLELFYTLPYRLSMFVIAPLPWQINSTSTLVAFFADAIIRYYVTFRVIRAMFCLWEKSVIERESIEVSFMVIALFDLIFCLGTTNYGQAMRHRAKMLPFELTILSLSGKHSKKRI